MSGGNWDLRAELERIKSSNLDGGNRIIAQMWAYHRDLLVQGDIFARAKTYYGRELSKVVVAARAAGEKSATAAEHTAEARDDIYAAHLAYRQAEQIVAADKEALRILHGELEKYRTDRADQRAADQFQAREQV